MYLNSCTMNSKSSFLNTENSHSMSLNKFLLNQEDKLNWDDSECVEQIIQIKQEINQIKNEFKRNYQSEEEQEDFIFNVKSNKVNWDNKESFMHVFINTTQVKKLEQERANRQYQHMMFASLSHELRTPLNAFSNSLYLVQFTFDEVKTKFEKYPEVSHQIEPMYPRLHKYLKIGEVSSCLLMNLVDDILDMSKFDAKTFQLNISEFKLSDLLKDIDYIFGFQCAEKHIGFSINCESSTAENTYWSDCKRIKQVLINLVSNSFKFTERGRIQVKVTDFNENECSYLKFSVLDTGIGICKDDIPKLFKMFGILSKHRDQLNQSGSGLGLSISKKIVESLGGKIQVSSKENVCTKFIFTIKLEEKKYSFFEEVKDTCNLVENKHEFFSEIKYQENENIGRQFESSKSIECISSEDLNISVDEDLSFRRTMLRDRYSSMNIKNLL